MPAGAGAPRLENGGLVAGIVCLSYLPPSATPLDSRLRGNDDLGGDSTGATYFPANRSCRLVPAHRGMKTEALTGGGVCGSFATHTPPLDSRFRENDECEGIPTDPGMTRPTVVTGTIHPGSESGTCFRASDDTGGLTGAAFSPTNEERRGRIDIGAHRRG